MRGNEVVAVVAQGQGDNSLDLEEGLISTGTVAGKSGPQEIKVGGMQSFVYRFRRYGMAKVEHKNGA
tara:strand:+ start:545 stop:745 length:201 start_codon:yes stop_codon:yes gene_type:complete